MRCEACLHTPDVRVGDPDHPSQVSRAHRGLDPQSAKFLAGTPEEVCRPPRSALARRLPRRHALSLAPAAYQPLICVWNMLMFRLTTGTCPIRPEAPESRARPSFGTCDVPIDDWEVPDRGRVAQNRRPGRHLEHADVPIDDWEVPDRGRRRPYRGPGRRLEPGQV